MKDRYVSSLPLSEFDLWSKVGQSRVLSNITYELTPRCNLDCKHCYINLPANDSRVRSNELSLEEITKIANDAIDLGTLWWLLSGGEPLLHPQFEEIMIMLKEKGFLVSVFTNAAIISNKHIDLFKEYPPRDIEVTVYGVTEETYEKISRKKGSYKAFRCGLQKLLDNGIRVRLKAMALRSNFHEFPEIIKFCKETTKDFFRADPMLHLRYDLDPERNEEIKSERLEKGDVLKLDAMDSTRSEALALNCPKPAEEPVIKVSDKLFTCNVGKNSAVIGYDGKLRPCSSLIHPDFQYDLKKGRLKDGWENFIPKVREMRIERESLQGTCGSCNLFNLCLWCPAHAYLETGNLEADIPGFCQIAHARQDNALNNIAE